MSTLSDLKRAARNERKARITYTKRDGSTVTRYVSPYEVKGGMLYADHSGRTKSFYLSHISSVHEATVPTDPLYPVKM